MIIWHFGENILTLNTKNTENFLNTFLNIINVFKDDKSLTFISDLTQSLGAVYDS